MSKPSLVVLLSLDRGSREQGLQAWDCTHLFSLSSSPKRRPNNTLRVGLLAVELLELLHRVLIDRVHHIDHLLLQWRRKWTGQVTVWWAARATLGQGLNALLTESLQEGGRGDDGDALASDVVDVLLALLHAVNVFLGGQVNTSRTCSGNT